MNLETKLQEAIKQWRDDLIDLGLRNPLINFRQRNTSTLDLSSQPLSEIFPRINSRKPSFLVGTKPAIPDAGVTDDDLEAQALKLEEYFDYSKHPDSLFLARTQREVDKTVRYMAALASRSFLDKGFNPLHLALGGLKWADDTGEARLAPLLLVPVKFTRPGPRQPHALETSEEDIVVNPALVIKLQEYGIVLPSDVDVEGVFESSGIEAALDLFHGVSFPDGWQIENTSALALFSFQKEAMFRDLLHNERSVLENPLVRALGSGGLNAEENFFFDPVDEAEIDVVAPPESTPLILDSDSSQRAAVEAAMQGRSFVLDGPPGTGKSQTIANMVGALISQGKSVLFVSEKIVALEVVKKRLDERGLGSLLLEIHSSKTPRKEVAQTLGRSLQNRLRVPDAMSDSEVEAVQDARFRLSDYANAMNERRQPLDKSVYDALGLIEQFGGFTATPEPNVDFAGLSRADFERLSDSSDSLDKHWDLFLEGAEAAWFGLERQTEIAFNLEALSTALDEYERNYDYLYSLATNLRLQGTFDFGSLTDLLETWSTGNSEFRSKEWLTEVNPDLVKRNLVGLRGTAKKIEALRGLFRSHLGASWDLVPGDMTVVTKSNFTAINEHFEGIESVSTDRLARIVDIGTEITKTLAKLNDALPAFSSSAGLSGIDSLKNLEAYPRSLEILISDNCPPTDWLSSKTSLRNAEGALNELESGVTAVIDAARNAEGFSHEVMQLDLDTLRRFFAENSGFFDRFSSHYRRHKQSLKKTAITSKWSKILASLPAAISWQSAHRELAVLESQFAANLGGHYQGLNTRWENLRKIVERAQAFSAGITIERPEIFASQIESQKFVTSAEHIMALMGELRGLIEAMKETTGSDFSRRVLRSGLDQLSEALNESLDFFHSAKDNSDQLNVHAGVTLKLIDLVEGFEALHQFRNLSSTLENDLSEISRVLQVAIPLEQFSTNPHSTVDRLEERREWTMALIERATARGDEKGVTRLLTQEEFEALVNCVISPELSSAAARWSKASKQFIDAFSDERKPALYDSLHEFDSARKFIKKLRKDTPQIEAWLDLARSRDELIDAGMARVIDAADTLGLRTDRVAGFLKCAALRGWVDHVIGQDSRLQDQLFEDRDRLSQKFRDLDRELADLSIANIVTNNHTRRPTTRLGQGKLIQREAEKKTRHLPVRTQIAQSEEVIKALHPCFMMSPLAVSQLLPHTIRFDVVIFDEASQVRPSDAINCIYRADTLIAAGDQKQLPPTNFFHSGTANEEDLEENVAGDWESILDLMKGSGAFNSLTLRWHYRSRHEHLIAFSNTSFYGGNLVTFPGAIDQSPHLGVKLIKVEDGVYRRANGSDNPREALRVAERIIHHFDSRPDKSLGVVAFSSKQRDTVEAAIALARKDRPDLDRFFESASTDRQQGFFVANLEQVQGDERDVIIFSVGYGPDENGKIHKNFGPVSRNGGERRLNVAFTRARELVEVVSSMDAGTLGRVGPGPAQHLRRYLDFAERGPAALAMELEGDRAFPESPFEEAVISEITSWGYQAVPQVGVAGYRIDIGITHPQSTGTFILGVECDGAMYHSSRTARDRDRLRHEILEGLGWRIHHIWGTSWYRQRSSEIEKLRDLLDNLSKDAPQGLVQYKKDVSPSPVVVAFEDIEERESVDWVFDYEAATVGKLPGWLDLSDKSNAHHLVELVTNVVSVEQPVHEEILLQRVREAADIGRVGNRIQKTLRAALRRAQVQHQDDFLWIDAEPEVRVRRASQSGSRAIRHIHPQELEAAVLGVTRDAVALDKKQLVEGVSRLFGWQRKGAQISAELEKVIDALVETGRLISSDSGLSLGIPDS